MTLYPKSRFGELVDLMVAAAKAKAEELNVRYGAFCIIRGDIGDPIVWASAKFAEGYQRPAKLSDKGLRADCLAVALAKCSRLLSDPDIIVSGIGDGNVEVDLPIGNYSWHGGIKVSTGSTQYADYGSLALAASGGSQEQDLEIVEAAIVSVLPHLLSDKVFLQSVIDIRDLNPMGMNIFTNSIDIFADGIDDFVGHLP